MTDKTKCEHWEHFPHKADIGIRGAGATKEQAFEQAAGKEISSKLNVGNTALFSVSENRLKC